MNRATPHPHPLTLPHAPPTYASHFHRGAFCFSVQCSLLLTATLTCDPLSVSDKAGPRLSTCSDRKPWKMNVLKVGQIMKYYKTRLPCLHFKNALRRRNVCDKCLKTWFGYCLGIFRGLLREC